jgi:hypothetical protein
MPYTSPVPLRANQSKNSTITTNSNNQELDDRSPSPSPSMDVNAIHPSSEQNQLNQEQDPFERSSDDEQEVRHLK